jgi:hypothetical protein
MAKRKRKERRSPVNKGTLILKELWKEKQTNAKLSKERKQKLDKKYKRV